MPLRAAVPHVIRHHIVFNRSGEFYTMVIHVEHTGTPTQAMVDADRDVIVSWLTSTWKFRAAVGCSAYYIKSWSMESVPPTKFADRGLYPAAPVNASRTGTRAPLQLGLVVSFRTGSAGTATKPLHGRVYHVGGHVLSDLLDDGVLTTGEFNNVVACYDALRTAFNYTGNVGRLVIVSFVAGGTRTAKVWRTTPVVAPVTHVLADNRLRTQRRRGIKQRAYTVN